MSGQHLNPEAHRLRRSSCCWSSAAWQRTAAGAKTGAIIGVTAVIVFGGIALHLLRFPPHSWVESGANGAFSAAVAGVICGGIIVVGIFAVAGAMLGVLIETLGKRPPDESASR